MKNQILAAIGEHGLQPAAALNAGLAANDRVKYAFSLLQMALVHVEHPDQPVATLKQERIACGIDEPDLDEVVAAARRIGKLCRVPGAARIMARIAEDMRLMAAPILATPAVTPKGGDIAVRLDLLLASLPTPEDDLLDPEATSAMMQAGHGHADSLHRLVMDLHKRLNAMQAGLAEETIDGAAASFAPPVPPILARANVASMGAASGAIALDPAAVQRLTAAGTPAILVRRETVTADIEGMALAAGILTASGGRTSHAAVVARQLGKVCLVACPDLEIDLGRRQCTIGATLLNEGDWLSLDGNTGAVHAGKLTPQTERPDQALAIIDTWRRAAAA